MVARFLPPTKKKLNIYSPYTSQLIPGDLNKLKELNPIITKGECSLYFPLIYSLSVWGNQKAKEETMKKILEIFGHMKIKLKLYH